MAKFVNIARMSIRLGLSVANFGLNQLLKLVKSSFVRMLQTFLRTTSL